ncbi:hypothetical protein V6N13_110613 [Hibiscus sabdariffa]|uniref:PGG domain-containing protein n=1 Tax=Hibiscus sabdariffa TaxID=183260 RepID=A0ABR2TI63_9ROSI
MRKNISNSTRNALLVVLVLILTATYQSAVNPPYELANASLRQPNNLAFGNLESNAQSFPFEDPDNQPENGGNFPFPPFAPTDNQPENGGDRDTPFRLTDLVELKVDPLALSFAIFNAVDFFVTILVTLFILPLVPYGQLLHVPLLLVFIFFVLSMGLSLVLTTSVVGILVFVAFAASTMFLGIFIVNIKFRNRRIYRQHIKEFVERARIRKNDDASNKKK